MKQKTKDIARSYKHSSSLQMAVLFTSLCSVVIVILLYFSVYFWGNEETRHLAAYSLLGIVCTIAVIITSFLISRFVVQRTNMIAQTAQNIIHTGDLSQRIHIGSRWDDIGYMVQVLNALLGRIEELLESVNNVSTSIAHDLRTPLTRMRGHIDELLNQDNVKQHPEITEYCQSILREADQTLSTFNALLRISRIETEKQRHQFSKFDLGALVKDVCDFYEPLADDKEITVSCNEINAPYDGDKDLIFQALANILDNSIKFTPPQGNISVSLGWEGHKYKLSVSDTGPGLKDEEQIRIFERFYRGEKSRNSSGNGLGMSLVKAIIDLHQGDIRMKNRSPGLRIDFIL